MLQTLQAHGETHGTHGDTKPAGSAWGRQGEQRPWSPACGALEFTQTAALLGATAGCHILLINSGRLSGKEVRVHTVLSETTVTCEGYMS